MASANEKIRWHMEYFWADAETVGFPKFSVPQPIENVVDDRRQLAEAYSEYVSRLTKFLYPHGLGCALQQPSSVFEELIATSYAEISGISAPAMPLSEWIGNDQFTDCRITRRSAEG